MISKSQKQKRLGQLRRALRDVRAMQNEFPMISLVTAENALGSSITRLMATPARAFRVA